MLHGQGGKCWQCSSNCTSTACHQAAATACPQKAFRALGLYLSGCRLKISTTGCAVGGGSWQASQSRTHMRAPHTHIAMPSGVTAAATGRANSRRKMKQPVARCPGFTSVCMAPHWCGESGADTHGQRMRGTHVVTVHREVAFSPKLHKPNTCW